MQTELTTGGRMRCLKRRAGTGSGTCCLPIERRIDWNLQIPDSLPINAVRIPRTLALALIWTMPILVWQWKMDEKLKMQVLSLVKEEEGWAEYRFAEYGHRGYPLLPWLVVPQRFGPRLPLPNPPIYAQGPSSNAASAYANYRWEMFYLHADTTTAAPAASASDAPADKNLPGFHSVANIDPSQKGGQVCRSITAVGPGNVREGFCVNENSINQDCHGITGESPTCRITQRCCLAAP
ncbi:hypothetical protein BV898_00877 [Hypsibius exemplaris]|uniref:Uncharacterized protein n=1 Tax=Hypsibius exemplaris TaxID=2072580 RepID=A0A1W0XCQ2_HYPEX|nr:hypothetical protein BV898_00877 [Hypsibius exemplaris]